MGRCRRHPHHLVVGVCAYCLNERLSAAKLQGFEDPPITLTSCNPSTSCSSIMPNPPPSANHRAHMPHYHMIDDIASSSQFSLPLSPQRRLESHYNTTSSSLSPQNQVVFGNPEFIKGEIPARKSKSSFWSFLHCSDHQYGLEDGDDGIQVDGVHMPSTSQMRAQRWKGRRDRHGLPARMSFSSMREFQAYGQRLSPSIRREGLHGNHSRHAHINIGDYAHGSERQIDGRENRLGISSSWKSWLFPQRGGRSRSISGLNDVGTHRAPPDAEPRSASFADQAYGSPRFSVSRSRDVPKLGDNHRAPNMHSKSPERSSFHGYFGKGSSHASAYASHTNHADSPSDFLSFAAYAHSSPPSVKPISSLPRCNLNLRFLEDSYTMLVHDELRRSPMQPAVPAILAPIKTKRAEHHGDQDMESIMTRAQPRCNLNLQFLEDSYTMHFHMRSPMQPAVPIVAPIRTKRAEHYDNQDMGSWSKVLRKTLAKKQGMKRQGNDPCMHAHA